MAGYLMAFTPALLVLLGGAMCATGERHWFDGQPFRALVIGLPGVAFVAMGIVGTVLILSLIP